MLFGHKRKNHVARYFLNNWIRYEKDINEIHPDEINNVKLFYTGLQKLSQEERLYLASQYRTSRGKRYTDTEIAKIKGVSVQEHKQKRVACETTLQNALKEIDEKKL